MKQPEFTKRIKIKMGHAKNKIHCSNKFIVQQTSGTIFGYRSCLSVYRKVLVSPRSYFKLWEIMAIIMGNQ